MVITGVHVSQSTVRQISIEVRRVFSDIPQHWKRDLFYRTQVVFVPSDAESAIDLGSDFCFVLAIDESGPPVDPEEVASELVLVYLGTLVNFDKAVNDIVMDVITSFKVAHEDMLPALVSWLLLSEEDWTHMSPTAIFACEEVDRQLRDLYPLPAITHGLIVQ